MLTAFQAQQQEGVIDQFLEENPRCKLDNSLHSRIKADLNLCIVAKNKALENEKTKNKIIFISNIFLAAGLVSVGLAPASLVIASAFFSPVLAGAFGITLLIVGVVCFILFDTMFKKAEVIPLGLPLEITLLKNKMGDDLIQYQVHLSQALIDFSIYCRDEKMAPASSCGDIIKSRICLIDWNLYEGIFADYQKKRYRTLTDERINNYINGRIEGSCENHTGNIFDID